MATKNTCIKEARDEVIAISAEENARRMKWAEDRALLDIRLAYSHGVDMGRIDGKNEGEISGNLKALLKIAKQMLTKKYSISEIKDLTGLSEKQINDLAKNI